jgi:hypothetical protein
MGGGVSQPHHSELSDAEKRAVAKIMKVHFRQRVGAGSALLREHRAAGARGKPAPAGTSPFGSALSMPSEFSMLLSLCVFLEQDQYANLNAEASKRESLGEIDIYRHLKT